MSDAPTSDTDESPINQPMADSLTARFVQRLPLTRAGNVETTLGFVDTRRAFRNTYACETADGDALIGAVRVRPASKSMVDDLSDEVRTFAAALTAGAEGKGMLVDVPRPVDTTTHQEAMQDVSAEFGGDDASWSEQLRADLAEEEAAVEALYEHTTTARDHYIVLRVDKLDAAKSLNSSESAFTNLPVIGGAFTDKNLNELKSSDRLHRQMVNTLATRLDRLAGKVSNIEGVSASPVSSVRLSEVLARYYRVDDPTMQPDFSDYIRQSPIPGNASSTYTNGISHARVSVGDEPAVDPVTMTDGEDRARAYQGLLAPQCDVSPERDGSFSIGDREVATIMVTGFPSNPADAFLEPLYRYDNPNAEVTIATHFDRKETAEAQREAKNAENSLEDKLETKYGGVFEDVLKPKYEDAASFSEALATSDYGVFEVGMFITVSAEATIDGQGNHVPASDVLDEAVDDIIETELKERCGLGAQRLDDAHHKGWQTTAPAATNHVGTNATMRADALAAQLPYQYRNLNESGGIRVGVHEYLQEASHLNVFGDDRGNGYNVGIYGMIGSGKTTTSQDLAHKLYQKHQHIDENLKLILSTPLRDFQGLSEALGGERIVIGGGTGINPQAIRYVPPEKLRAVGDEKRPWNDMLERLDACLETYYQIEGLESYGTKKSVWMRAAKTAQRENGIIPGEPETYKRQSATLQDTIDNVMEMRQSPEKFVREDVADDQDTLNDIAEVARTIIARDIEAFREDGRFAHFTEPSGIDLSEHEVLFLDFQHYDGDEQMGGLEMQMRLSDLYEQAKSFDGRTFFVVDEFATMLENPRSAQFFNQTHRRSRHWDLSVCLATQEFGDLFEEQDGEVGLNDSAEVIMNNQAMQFYHFTKEMSDKWGDELDLSKRSQEFIDGAKTGKAGDGYAHALAVVDGDEYPLRVEMSDKINPRAFAIYQHDPTKHPPLKEYLKEYGATPEVCNWRWAE